MKIKYLFTLLIIFSVWAKASNSQNLRLIIDNPLPRINQEISFSYFYTNSEIENRFEANIDNAGDNNLIIGNIKINDSIITGSHINLGPIQIKYNGKYIKSDSLTVKVFNALPDTNQGIWINHVIIEGSKFIIIEQRVPLSLGKTEYASFNRGEFLKFNVEPFVFSTLTTSIQSNDNSFEKNEYAERRTILLLRNLENLKSNLNINESFFNDLPIDCQPIKLLIKKEY